MKRIRFEQKFHRWVVALIGMSTGLTMFNVACIYGLFYAKGDDLEMFKYVFCDLLKIIPAF